LKIANSCFGSIKISLVKIVKIDSVFNELSANFPKICVIKYRAEDGWKFSNNSLNTQSMLTIFTSEIFIEPKQLLAIFDNF